MTSDFTPLDREHDPADALLGSFASDGYLDDPATAEVSDHWIDEALRTVPLPEGFLARMSRLAQPAQADAQLADLSDGSRSPA